MTRALRLVLHLVAAALAATTLSFAAPAPVEADDWDDGRWDDDGRDDDRGHDGDWNDERHRDKDRWGYGGWGYNWRYAEYGPQFAERHRGPAVDRLFKNWLQPYFPQVRRRHHEQRDRYGWFFPDRYHQRFDRHDCRRMTKWGHDDWGRRVKIGALKCADRNGRAFIFPGSQFVIGY